MRTKQHLFRQRKYGIAPLLAVFLIAVLAVIACFSLVKPEAKAANVNENINCETASGNYLDNDYVNVYKVPTSEFTYSANGGGSIGNAFDGNWGSYWNSARDNGNGLVNAVTVTFAKPVEIESILYASSSERIGYGYPQILTIYTANGGDLAKYGKCYSTPTNSRVVFRFDETQTVTQLKFEFTQPHTAHRWDATAKEIQFLQPDNESANKVLDLFSDYTQYTVKNEYRRELDQIRDDVKGLLSYESALKPLLDRAEAVVSGLLKKDVHREFQTDPNARNPINQYGDMAQYARNELLLNSIGTNRQVIGIGGTTREEIVVYVEAEENDPLPQIAFTQIYGAWNSWWSTATLKRGKNVFTFPNFVYSDKYSVPINAGGPIHIINPYTPEQQSSNVKIYIEGGYIYPVFHDGDDETTFKMMLEDYYAKLQDPENSDITIDAFEAVSDSIILSCRATNAYNGYIKRGLSPQLNIDRWTSYMLKMLSFGGVDCFEGGKYYDVRNEHITINYRAVQPYAGFYAFAAGEHIGIPDQGSHDVMVMRTTPGWAFAHELGHTVDLRGRIWGEVTNNMWSIYDRYMIEANFDDRVNLGRVSGNLASDFSSSVNRLWNPDSYNSSFWYMIEGGCPGYWAGSENAYRYELARETDEEVKNLIKQLDSTEKMLYFGSIGANDDLRDYFERWGFYMNGGSAFNSGNRWSKAKQSATLSTLMDKAKASGKIAGDGKKYWYIDINQYKYLREHGEVLGDWASCYSSNDVINITSVLTVGNTYTLLLPTPKNQEAHLGYEIQSKINGEWKVVGFTYNSSFTDSYNYNGETPTYRVVAYDRKLNHSGVSAEHLTEPDVTNNVCRIGETYYNTLKEAVDASRTGDTIILLKSCNAGGISFRQKKVVICPDNGVTEDLIITKSSSGPMFNLKDDQVYGGSTSLQIGNNSTNGAKIILDGNNFYQSGALIQSGSSPVTLNNVELRNNVNSGNGGAIYVGMETTLYLNKVVIANNSAANGGGIYMEGRTRAHLNNVTVKNNVASTRGGGVYVADIYGGGTFTNTNSRNSANIITGNTASYGGGIYAENTLNLFNFVISENSASAQGGGIYGNVSYGRGNIGMTTCTMQNNSSPVGSTFYINRGKVYLNGGAYNGHFYKLLGGGDASELYFNMKMPDFSGAEFELSSIGENGTVLVNGITNFTATEEQAQTLTVKNGHPVLKGTQIFAHGNIIRITVNSDAGTFSFERQMGKFTLPECVPEYDESKYLSDWVVNGTSYNAGDVINLVENITVEAKVHRYCVVTIKYGTSEEIKYFKENDVFYMPMKTPDDQEVNGFRCSNGEYYVYADAARITGDMVFDADKKKLLNVTYILDGEKEVRTFEYGSNVLLSAPVAPVGKYFKHWLLDDRVYAVNSKIKATADFTVRAVFSDIYRVNFIVDGETTSADYQYNSLIKLEVPAKIVPNMMFKHWISEEKTYLAGSDYVVLKNVDITAVYEAATAQRVGLTFTVGEASETLPTDVNTEFTLPTPTAVPEGKVFLHWTINGVKYKAGDKIYATQDLAVAAVLADNDNLEDAKVDYVIQNVEFAGNSETEISKYQNSVGYGENLTLKEPERVPEGYKFSHYEVNGDRKDLGTTVAVNSGAVLKAVYVASVEYVVKNVVIKRGFEKEISKSYLFAAVNESVVLARSANDPDRCTLQYFVVNGQNKNIGDSITISEGIDIKAVYLQEIDYAITNVVFKRGEEKEVSQTEKVIDMGESLTLTTPSENPARCNFLYYIVDGERKNLGDRVAVYPDTEIKAVYNMEIDCVIRNITLNGEEEVAISDMRGTFIMGEGTTLAKPTDAPEGYNFLYYLIDGERKNVGDVAEIYPETVIKAVYSLAPDSPDAKDNTVLIVVIVVVVVLVLAAAGAAAFIILKKKKQAKNGFTPDDGGEKEKAPKAKKQPAEKKAKQAEAVAAAVEKPQPKKKAKEGEPEKVAPTPKAKAKTAEPEKVVPAPKTKAKTAEPKTVAKTKTAEKTKTATKKK